VAIVKGLNEDSILWKYQTTERRVRMHPENRWQYMRDERGNYIYDDVPVYHLIKLYTRRARTSGTHIETNLKPFFEKLKIKLIAEQRYTRGTYVTHYRAVGCEDVRVNEEEWNNAELHEVAQKYYDKVSNLDLLQLMDQESEISMAIIEELKNLVQELDAAEETEEAVELEEDARVPNEPQFYEYDHRIWA
jgi:hypothetical protein